MARRIHLLAGVTGFLTILTFWTATVAAEASGSHHAVTEVKQTIPWGLLILVPALALTGATGLKMAGQTHAPLVARKRRRMPFIAANGLLILAPAALLLAHMASQSKFSQLFYTVQAVELVAGMANLLLMGLNIRDGLRLSGQSHRQLPE